MKTASAYAAASAPALESDTLQRLYTTLDSCGKCIAAAEKGLFDGSVAATRAAFQQAEKDFEKAQEWIADSGSECLPEGVEKVISSLGLRLDALWVRMICLFR